MESNSNWQDNIFQDDRSGFSLDLNFVDLVKFKNPDLKKWQKAITDIAQIEQGAIANPDEGRMVGHYWLRNSTLSPNKEIKLLIDETYAELKKFTADVISGKIKSCQNKKYNTCLLIGIGGSALGPQFLEQSLAKSSRPFDFYYFDNTDPAGLVDVLESIPDLSTTLVLVISKSGGTRETRNGMLIAEKAWKSAGLSNSQNFVAVTQIGSALDQHAKKNSWLKTLPMWDWVGGRVSLWSAVGLLPALLMGINTDQLLAGASHMDQLTRRTDLKSNPAGLLSMLWYTEGNAKGEKILVMLPYRDQIASLSKYLQQLIMESVGKELDNSKAKVNQGLYVLGNKGSTDQHSYIQQLREGPSNFIAHFIEVLKDDSTLNDFTNKPYLKALNKQLLEEDSTAGDYLSGFLQGTRTALFENGRSSITLTIDTVSEFNVGMLLALFERAVSLYASYINVNAYHQPGVEAGKKAAGAVINVQIAILELLKNSPTGITLNDIVDKLGSSTNAHMVYSILKHLSANQRVGVESNPNLNLVKYKLS